MWIPLLISAALAVPSLTPGGKPTGTIAGSIAAPVNVRISKPVQVVVFSGDYVDLYLADVQKRLDNYWEDYKLAFIQDKQAFLLFRERALRQAMDSTLNLMRKEDPLGSVGLVQTTTNNSFQFRNVPLGECKVVALVTVGNQEFIWSESVILTSAGATVTIKPTSP